MVCLRSLALLFLSVISILAFSLSCVRVNSQSRLEKPLVSPTTDEDRLTRVTINNSELELVIRQYFDLALNGKYDEIVKLTTVKSIPKLQLTEQEKKNGLTSPDFKMLEELERAEVEKGFPELINTGRYRVVSIKSIAENEQDAMSSVVVSRPFSPERSRLLIFKLLKVNNYWRIYYVTFKEVDDALSKDMPENSTV